MKRQLPWLIAMPLAVVGTLAGHSVGYWAAVPDAHERAHVLAASGHAYLAYAPLAMGLSVALAALGLVAHALAAFRRREATGGTRIKLVAALAPTAFVLQEVIERYVHDGYVPWQFVVSAPFLLGLATQVPFALLTAAIAFALATAARHVAQVIRGAGRPQARGTALTFLSWLSVDLPTAPVLASGFAGRGPPLLT
jgi:hypothetical protein